MFDLIIINNDECARCSSEIWCSVLALVLDKIKALSTRFFKVLEHLARTEH
jgi:hypothetical protein